MCLKSVHGDQVILYLQNFIQIYLWKTISLVTGFLSLILVVPQISENQEIFGIYSFVISLSLYFSYADIGFISTGQKYAAEAYATSDWQEEIKILGFTIAVLICMFVPMMFFLIYCYWFPEVVFNDLSKESSDVAGGLLLVLGFFTPIQVILQRAVSIIFAVRLLDFIVTRIDILFNLVKLSSLFYFFTQDSYMIVEYFLFCTLVTILGSVLGLVYLALKLEFKLAALVKSIRLSRAYYNKAKKLAFASATTTLGFILYYEMDLILVGYLFGIKEIAIYAIAFTFMNFFRSLLSIIYSPFSVRLNHLVGLNDRNGITALLNGYLYYIFPLFVMVTICLIMSAETLVQVWVGQDYLSSIILLQILLITFAPSSLTSVGYHYLFSHERRDYIYTIAVISPIIFYGIVFSSYYNFGLVSLAYAKCAVVIVQLVLYWMALRSIMSPWNVINKWVAPLGIWAGLMILSFPFILDKLNLGTLKSSGMLIELIFFLGFLICTSYISLFSLYKKNRVDIQNFVKFLVSKRT